MVEVDRLTGAWSVISIVPVVKLVQLKSHSCWNEHWDVHVFEHCFQ